MFEQIKNSPRLLLEAELVPMQGERFQPTGFPDIGAAEYTLPDGTRKILVESAQSMANRLEKVCLKGEGPDVIDELTGLPYIRVNLVEKNGNTCVTTSSLVEPHRINSPFIIQLKAFQELFEKKSGYKKGVFINWSSVAETFFYYDPCSIIHGVFMANLGDGRVRIPRALTSFVEAENVREAESGGVKFNPFDPKGKIRAKEYDKDVYGNVPYHRTEYTAEKIIAYFNLDISLLKGYGLPEEATDLLIALSLLKIRRLLSGGLRLRTSCDLKVTGENVTLPDNYKIPDESSLTENVKSLIKACAEKGLFASPPVTLLKTEVVEKKEDKE